MSDDFDLFVIGGGSGGIAAARRAGEYGARVGLAEAGRLGGTCVNRGCVPKKFMVYASHFPDQFEEAEGYGWSLVKSTLDWSALIGAIEGEVQRLNRVYQTLLDKTNVKLFPDYAQFVDSHTLQVGDRTVTADKILIAVGGKPVKPVEIIGIEHMITSDDIFHLPKQPKHAVIVGGGYIGTEFACILNGLGSKVTQVIRNDKILRGFDEDIRNEIQMAMQSHGVQILHHTQIVQIEKLESGLKVHVVCDAETTMIADVVGLAATGRRPNVKNLGLKNTKVELKNGAIAVNDYNQTDDPTIYAVGDCIDRINLTPVAINEGRAFADTHFGNKPRKVSYENVPTAIFSTPEAATVGLTEAKAKQHYGADAIKVYRSRFRPMYYTLTGKDEKTLMKLVVHQETDKVLGAHMVGNYAAEIIQGVAIAVKMGATKADFDATIGIHPTSAEEFVTMR